MITHTAMREALIECVRTCNRAEGMLMLGFLYGMIHQLEQRWPEMQAYRGAHPRQTAALLPEGWITPEDYIRQNLGPLCPACGKPTMNCDCMPEEKNA